MTNLSTRFQSFLPVATALLLGAILVPFAGVENDEALFAVPLYLQNPKDLSIGIFHRRLPVMVMSYVGTLKTLLYLPILSFFRPNVWNIRVPMVLAGALTVYFLFKLVSESTSRPAGLAAAFLLATDPCFLLTDTFDWGPVALEHLLLVTACFCLFRFARKNQMRDLALGFFLLGLALWNKAIFLWALSGLATAGLVVFHRQVLKFARVVTISVALSSFVAGALPFILYNVHERNATLSSNAHLDTMSTAWHKAPMMVETLDGHGLFGFLPRSDWESHPKPVRSVSGRLAWWVRRHVGAPEQNGFEYVFLFCLACAPWWWRRKLAWFSLIFIGVTWTAMAFTHDAGASVHHTVLVWPFPQVFMAVALSSLPWPKFSAVALGAMVAMNLLVVDQYVAEFERNGAAGSFADALLALPKVIPDPPLLDADHIYVVDWGMLNTLALYHQGQLPLVVGDPPFMTDHPSIDDQHMIDAIMNDRRGLFVGHLPDFEVNRGVRERLEKIAAERSLRKKVLQVVYDSNGRGVFEIFRLMR